jgi:hypothetical protein
MRYPITKLPRAFKKSFEQVAAALIAFASHAHGTDMIDPRLKICLLWFRAPPA